MMSAPLTMCRACVLPNMNQAGEKLIGHFWSNHCHPHRSSLPSMSSKGHATLGARHLTCHLFLPGWGDLRRREKNPRVGTLEEVGWQCRHLPPVIKSAALGLSQPFSPWVASDQNISDTGTTTPGLYLRHMVNKCMHACSHVCVHIAILCDKAIFPVLIPPHPFVGVTHESNAWRGLLFIPIL